MAAPVKASLWFVFASVIQKGISFVTTPIFTRLLSTEEYGLFNVYSSWYDIVAIFCTLHLAAGVYNKGMTKWNDDRDKLTSSFQGLSTVVTLLFFVVYLVFSEFWNDLLGLSSVLVMTLFCEALFIPAFEFWKASKRYDYSYKAIVLVSIAIGVISPILGVIAIKNSAYKAEARIITFALVQIVIGLFLYINNLRKGKCFFSKEYWVYALKFNLPLIPHYLANTVLASSDRIMISKMVGTGEAGIYSVAYIISGIFSIVTIAINNSFIPFTYKAIKNNNITKVRESSIVLVCLICGLCLFALCFGPELILLISTPEYYEARWVVPPVAIATLFTFIYTLFSNVEFYFEKTKLVMVASSFAAILNIILNYIFIRISGYVAAAYTTLVCYMALAMFHYCAYKYVCKKNNYKEEIYHEKTIFLITLISLILEFLFTLVYDNAWIRYLFVVVLLFVVLVKKNAVISAFAMIKANDKKL